MIFPLVSLARSLVLAAVVAIATMAANPSAHAAAIFEQKEIRVTKSDPYLYLPATQAWDVLAYEHLVVKFKFIATSLDATKYVKVSIQTNGSLDNEDWKTVESATFTQGTDTAPKIAYGLINIEDTVPMSRYVRWLVEFEATTSTQYVTFNVVAVGRE